MKEGGRGGRKRGGTDCADYVDYCCEGVLYYSGDFIGAAAWMKISKMHRREIMVAHLEAGCKMLQSSSLVFVSVDLLAVLEENIQTWYHVCSHSQAPVSISIFGFESMITAPLQYDATELP